MSAGDGKTLTDLESKMVFDLPFSFTPRARVGARRGNRRVCIQVHVLTDLTATVISLRPDNTCW